MAALIFRLMLLSILPFLLLVFVGANPGAGLAWDFANACGLLSALVASLLFIYSGRPLSKPHYDGKFFMNLHRNLGFVVIVLLGIHVLVLLVSEPQVLDYLKPSANLPMVCGTLATLFMMVLVPASLPRLRQKLWSNHQRFKHWHYGLSAVALILTSIHVLGASFYTNAPWKVALWCALVAAILIKPLLPKPAPMRGNGPRRRNTAIYASWLSIGLVMMVLVLAAGFSMMANVDLPL